MRFGTLIMAAMLGVIALWSDRALASDKLLVPAIQKTARSPHQGIDEPPVRQLKSGVRRKNKIDAASAVADTEVLRAPKADGVIAAPDIGDKGDRRENGAPILELKGVRG